MARKLQLLGEFPSGGGNVKPEEVKKIIDEYFVDNPVQAGATAEEAAQIEQNKQNIATLDRTKLAASELPNAVNEALAQAKASGVFDGADGKDYVLTEADKQEIAQEAAGMVEPPKGGGIDVTGAEVGQIIKVSAVDGNGKPTAWKAVNPPTKLSDLENDLYYHKKFPVVTLTKADFVYDDNNEWYYYKGTPKLDWWNSLEDIDFTVSYTEYGETNSYTMNENSPYFFTQDSSEYDTTLYTDDFTIVSGYDIVEQNGEPYDGFVVVTYLPLEEYTAFEMQIFRAKFAKIPQECLELGGYTKVIATTLDGGAVGVPELHFNSEEEASYYDSPGVIYTNGISLGIWGIDSYLQLPHAGMVNVGELPAVGSSVSMVAESFGDFTTRSLYAKVTIEGTFNGEFVGLTTIAEANELGRYPNRKRDYASVFLAGDGLYSLSMWMKNYEPIEWEVTIKRLL